MRTIKFRVWDKANNEFLSKEEDWCWDILHDLNGQLHDRYEIQQYTGFADQNGKEIYEGDILKTYRNFGGGDFGDAFGEIKFDQLDAQFQTYERGEEFGQTFCPEISEVIGNIFETPELLK